MKKVCILLVLITQIFVTFINTKFLWAVNKFQFLLSMLILGRPDLKEKKDLHTTLLSICEFCKYVSRDGHAILMGKN